jgi:hypothetical protein
MKGVTWKADCCFSSLVDYEPCSLLDRQKL